ncbi:MAG: iron-containing alcohol dehydrogenase [Desulfitobacterium sp.]|nr:iron-containing alcohol dehydrogenase [Desulfitobacterium sp.]
MLLAWREPELLEGENSLERLPEFIKSKGIQRVLVVTDEGLKKVGLLDKLVKGLNAAGLNYVVYDKTVPNPTIDNIEEGVKLYHENNCQGIIALGGGSPMDCAKGIGARMARPNKTIPKMRGELKVLRKIPPFFAIPTTSGTGSETTLAAVVSNSKTHEKYAINDPLLIPHYAVHDPVLTVGLPPFITATTGMDALTHAVEAYIGRSNTKETIEWSRKAISLVFKYLYKAYANGEDLEARDKMQKASYYAGCAFTRAYVGYVHAIAHTLSGFYNTPHGLANAVLLPFVLEAYGESIHKSLGELGDLIGVTKEGDSQEVKAQKFIQAIEELNKAMNIPNKIEGIEEKDIPLMIQRALKEANPLYPVPKILFKDDLSKIYYAIRA